jgi:hypothetical protein
VDHDCASRTRVDPVILSAAKDLLLPVILSAAKDLLFPVILSAAKDLLFRRVTVGNTAAALPDD